MRDRKGRTGGVGSAGRKQVAVFKVDWLPGSETFIRNQIKYLHEWTAIPFGFVKCESPLADPSDVMIRSWLPIRLERVLTQFFNFSPAVRNFLIERSPDVVHVHFLTQARGVARISTRLGIPVVVTCHGQDVLDAPRAKGLRGVMMRRAYRSLGRDVTTFVAVSEFIRDRLIELGFPAEKIVLSYVGIDTSKELQRVEPTSDLLYVGRLIRRKGALDALEAAARAQVALGRTVTMTIVGSGELRPEIEQRARELGVDARFTGLLSPREVWTEMQSAAAFIHPAHSEGFGLVYLEASLAALPVIAYADSGALEAVEDGVTGRLTRCGDIDSLADAVRAVLQQAADGRRMGLAGRERVFASFDVEHLTRDLERIYDFVAMAGSSRPSLSSIISYNTTCSMGGTSDWR